MPVDEYGRTYFTRERNEVTAYVFNTEHENYDPNYKYHYDVEANTPKIYFDTEKRMWALNFDSVDIGGYDCANFTYYFESKNQLIQFIEE